MPNEYPVSELGIDACSRKLIARVNGKWRHIVYDGSVATFGAEIEISSAESPHISEYSVADNAFTINGSDGAVFSRKSPVEIHVSNAHFKPLNGSYKMGAFHDCYQHQVCRDLWYLRSKAGQWVFVTKFKFDTKVLAIHDNLKPRAIDASVDNNELLHLVGKSHLSKSKQMINAQRYYGTTLSQDSTPRGVRFSCSKLRIIPNANAGRANHTFISHMALN